MLTMCFLRFHASSRSCLTLWGSHTGEKTPSLEEDLAFASYFVPLDEYSVELVRQIYLNDIKCFLLKVQKQ